MDAQELKNQISQVVDLWVSDVVKTSFLEKPRNQQTRSLWDKFKQGLTNWWWGKNGEKYNPYRWKNRFGDELGVSESFNPAVFTLHEYSQIRVLVDSVETRLNESDEEFDGLRLMQIIRSAAERLKEMLFSALNGKVQTYAPRGQKEPAEAAGGATQQPRTGPVQDPRATKAPKAEKAAPSAASGTQDATSSADVSASTPVKAEPSAAASPTQAGEGNKDPEALAMTRAGRKTDRQRIEEAAEEVSHMQKSDIKPDLSWLNGKSQVKKERLPHVLAWMAMKSHKNAMEDEHIKDELQKALGKKVDLGLPGGGRIKLKNYLKRTLDDGFEKVMSLLGVDTVGGKEPVATAAKKGEVSSAGGGSGVVGPPKKDSKAAGAEVEAEKEVEDDQGSDLKGYLYDGDKPRTVRAAMTLIVDFVRNLAHDTSKKDELKGWWDIESQKFKKIPKGDMFEYLEASLMKSGEYVGAISKATGLSAGAIREKMKRFLDSAGSSNSDPSESPAKEKEENLSDIDESLGIDSYLKTDGKSHGINRSLELLDRFMKNPLSMMGVDSSDPRVRGLAEWWDREKEVIAQKSDPMEYVEKSLLTSGDWFRSIGEILKKSPDLIKNIMASHIKRRSNR